jgi:predicted Zn-dependent peptidase
MPFHVHKLPNGLQLIGESSPEARSVAVGFFVRTGSRDESAPVCGVSHFLEHMAFKGNAKRTALDVNRDFDLIGADYNAYTSEENTVYHAAVLPEYLPQVVDIVSNLLRPGLRQGDFDTEKQVIINEIGRYEDMPSWSAYDHAHRLYFTGHKLANSILGTKGNITDLTRDQMEEYYRRRYVAPNITACIAGRFDWEQFVALIEKHCGDWPASAAPRTDLVEAPGTGQTSVIHRDKVAQEYVLLLSPGPMASSPLRHAADLLSMAIGDDSGSRLYWDLVDPGLAESASCYFKEYEDTGVFFTSYTCEGEQTAPNRDIVLGVLQDVQNNSITAAELEQARNKILSRVVRSSERPKGRMYALGNAWTYYGNYRSVDDELRDYEKVTLGDVRQVLQRYPLTNLTTLALGPLPALG